VIYNTIKNMGGVDSVQELFDLIDRNYDRFRLIREAERASCSQ